MARSAHSMEYLIPPPQTRGRDDTFLRLVDFKWLMAGVGWWVSLSRLQSDRGYIDECLQRALKSDSELLRERSSELLGLSPVMAANDDAAVPRASSDC